MSRKVTSKFAVLVIVLLAALFGTQALAQSPRAASDDARENLLKTIYKSTWFVPNPDLTAIEDGEMARAYQADLDTVGQAAD